MKIVKLNILALIVISLVGCGSNNVKPKIETSDQFRIDKISLTVSQLVTPEIKYHSESELQDLLTQKVTSLLNKKNLITDNQSANSLDFRVKYVKRFVGDETPMPSDSLAYPQFGYEIDILEGAKKLTTISKNDLKYKGGFAMNLQVIAGSLRDKSHEVTFIDALAEKIVEEIEEL